MGWKIQQSDMGDGPRSPGPQSESGQCCVYNLTCERFLSADVETGDFTVQGLELRLQTFSPAGKALWLVPFRGISPTSVRIPLDLVYLDPECVVIEAVESFPIFRVSTTCRPAASVLVLPPKTVGSGSVRPGDQLIFRPPAEMKLVLERLANLNSEDQQGQAFASPSLQTPNQNSAQDIGQVVKWNDRSRQEPLLPADAENDPPYVFPEPVEELTPESAATPASQNPASQVPASPKEEPSRKKRSWLDRFLSAKPDDKRAALRESIPGLTAFFFTGGAPVPHGVRDISETGIYVLTDERWYPGTVIRITLTDQREPTSERSFTVNASVMRWGNDGVGLRFVFQSRKDRRSGGMSARERAMGVADAASFKEFLAILRGEKA